MFWRRDSNESARSLREQYAFVQSSQKLQNNNKTASCQSLFIKEQSNIPGYIVQYLCASFITFVANCGWVEIFIANVVSAAIRINFTIRKHLSKAHS